MSLQQEAMFPRVYFYVDATGIASLYAQTVNRTETGLVRETARTKGVTFGLKARIGQILGGLIGVDAGADGEMSQSRIETAKYELSEEQQLRLLLRSLARHSGSRYFTDLVEATNAATRKETGVFIDLTGKFDAPQFYPGAGGAAAANQAGEVTFLLGTLRREPYEFADDYFKSSACSYHMRAGIHSFTAAYDGALAVTGHEAIYFREFGGERIPIGVFGYLSHIRDSQYQIKPFALWRP